jgi:hypothetical protein
MLDDRRSLSVAYREFLAALFTGSSISAPAVAADAGVAPASGSCTQRKLVAGPSQNKLNATTQYERKIPVVISISRHDIDKTHGSDSVILKDR